MLGLVAIGYSHVAASIRQVFIACPDQPLHGGEVRVAPPRENRRNVGDWVPARDELLGAIRHPEIEDQLVFSGCSGHLVPFGTYMASRSMGFSRPWLSAAAQNASSRMPKRFIRVTTHCEDHTLLGGGDNEQIAVYAPTYGTSSRTS